VCADSLELTIANVSPHFSRNGCLQNISFIDREKHTGRITIANLALNLGSLCRLQISDLDLPRVPAYGIDFTSLHVGDKLAMVASVSDR
jgi:hypothetical protein